MKIPFFFRRHQRTRDRLITISPRSGKPAPTKKTFIRLGRRAADLHHLDMMVETKAGGELASVITTHFSLQRNGNLLAVNTPTETAMPVLSISEADLHIPVRSGTRSSAIEEILAETVTEEVTRIPRTLASFNALFATSLARSGEHPHGLIPATLAVAKLMLAHPVASSERSAIVGLTLGTPGSQLVVLWEWTNGGRLQKMEATPRTADVQGTIKSFANSKRITSVDEYERVFDLVSITLFDTNDLFGVLDGLKTYPRPGDWFGVSKQKLLGFVTPYVATAAVLALATLGYQGYQLMQLRSALRSLTAASKSDDRFSDLVANHTGALLKAASVPLRAAIDYAKAVAPPVGTVDMVMAGNGIKLTSHQVLPAKPGMNFPTTVVTPPNGCKQEQVQLTLTELKVTYACSNLVAHPIAVLYRSLH